MRTKAILLLSSVGLVAACGGSSTINSNMANLSAAPVKVFSDGAGVASLSEADGPRLFIIVPDIGGFVKYANENGGTDLSGTSGSLEIVQVLPTNAYLRQGAFESDGLVANITAVEDLGGDSIMMLATFPAGDIAIYAGGSALGSLPSGVHTYSGTLGMGRRSGNTQAELGSFTLSADFTNSSFSIQGLTNSYAVNGSGFINATSGRFTANSIDVTSTGGRTTGSVYGNLHGNNAESVSGVLHTNEANPIHAGAFVGSR
jgi:hypothetical protein